MMRTTETPDGRFRSECEMSAGNVVDMTGVPAAWGIGVAVGLFATLAHCLSESCRLPVAMGP